MTLPKALSIIVVIMIALSIDTFGQCDAKFQYSVESKAESHYSLSLKPQGSSYIKYTVQLYDLYQGKIIEEKTVVFSGNEKKVVFDKVQPSLYALYLRTEACKKPIVLGDKQGLKVGIN